MNILIVSTGKFDLDGITNVILNYYRALDKSGMHIDFAFPNEIRKDLREELEAGGSVIHRIKGRKKKPLTYMNKLTKLIKENKYDIVHAHGNSCTLALETYAAYRGGAKVRIPHSHNSTSNFKFAHWTLRRLFHATYTHGFACGKLAGEWLYGGKPFEIINNAIFLDDFKYNAEVRKEYRNKYHFAGKKVVGHIGHFTFQKNQDYLVEIFKSLVMKDPDYRLLLIGDGGLKSEVEKKVQDLGLADKVVFTGKSMEIPELLQAMDIMVMPSRFEGMPLTLVEAQAACLPCLISDEISREAEITSLVKFSSLKSSPENWAKQILEMSIVDREELKSVIVEQINNKGYNIVVNSEKMKALYVSYLEEQQ
ncbi:glycosyltransferase family 1 protein [Planococcus beigongshangi]|uniref:glycosyltransferase family 1 protein n=1 Tax=Planococcus beigongshangi TaxID=2782536 RepID=UPI00193C5B62|nr:glycosyltransferase family 1 protein [Planococcus beigongshangi]